MYSDRQQKWTDELKKALKQRTSDRKRRELSVHDHTLSDNQAKVTRKKLYLKKSNKTTKLIRLLKLHITLQKRLKYQSNDLPIISIPDTFELVKDAVIFIQ